MNALPSGAVSRNLGRSRSAGAVVEKGRVLHRAGSRSSLSVDPMRPFGDSGPFKGRPGPFRDCGGLESPDVRRSWAVLSRPGGGEGVLFDPLRFEPSVNVAFTKEDLLSKFDKGKVSTLHQFVDGSPADSQIFHKLPFGEKLFFHPGAYSIKEKDRNKERA